MLGYNKNNKKNKTFKKKKKKDFCWKNLLRSKNVLEILKLF